MEFDLLLQLENSFVHYSTSGCICSATSDDTGEPFAASLLQLKNEIARLTGWYHLLSKGMSILNISNASARPGEVTDLLYQSE